MRPKYPSLDDILENKAPHPYSFSNFVGFLSQNHCLETVEFTLDVARYTEKYSQPTSSKADLNKMWRKIVDAYIKPDSPKELNLPCEIKKKIANPAKTAALCCGRNNSTSSDNSMSCCCSILRNHFSSSPAYSSSSSCSSTDDDEPDPPSPSLLAPAVILAKDMMKENVYIPFLASVKCSTSQEENASNSPCFLGFCGSNNSHIPQYKPICQQQPSNASSPYSWQQPSSWESPCHSISKSSSSESLYAGDEHTFNTSGNISNSCRKPPSSSSATTSSSTPVLVMATGPMTPPESPQDFNEPLRSFSVDECAAFPLSKSSSSDVSNSTFPQYTETHTQQVGPYKSHWRKMSKRLKWRRGSDKDSKPLPPTSVSAAPPQTTST